ncbi:hypothetical protein BGZ89_011297, partial [Linnemannia elongata]
MSHNFSRIIQLPRHTEHTPTPLPVIVVSYDEVPHIQPHLIQYQLATVQVQLEALVIDTAREQDAEEDHSFETENMQSDHFE